MIHAAPAFPAVHGRPRKYWVENGSFDIHRTDISSNIIIIIFVFVF
jgi:hypothetical protein